MTTQYKITRADLTPSLASEAKPDICNKCYKEITVGEPFIIQKCGEAQHYKCPTADASQTREQEIHYAKVGHLQAHSKATAQAASAHTPHSNLPWEPEGAMKITSGIRYVANCFIGAENAGELEESKANRDFIIQACNNYTETAAERDSLKDIAADRLVRLFKAERERDRLREQVKTLLSVAQAFTATIFSKSDNPQQMLRELVQFKRQFRSAIASVESEQAK